MSGALAHVPEDLRRLLRDEDVPTWRPPMLATTSQRPFSDPAWIFEPKLDGVRCLAYRDRDKIRLLSRNRLSLDSTYPELTDALATQRVDRFVIDGEVVAFEGERTSFSRLQRRSAIQNVAAARTSGIPVFYYVFDVLHLDGYAAVDLPLAWRKQLLAESLSFADPLRFTPFELENGEASFKRACERGEEGVVAKRMDTRYTGVRSADWLKLKCVHVQEFVVGGFTAPKGSRVGFGALLVGYYEDGQFVYAGKVGTGYTVAMLLRLREKLQPLIQNRSPFTVGTPREADTTWVAPEMVAQVTFAEWTRDGKLRQPRFEGLRTDKPAADVVREPSG